MSAALISIGVNDYLFMASGGEIRELKDRKCQHRYSCRSSTSMGDKINFMALSCQNTGLFQSFMAYYAKTDYFLCVYELVNKVEIYFIEVSKRIICVRL